ncbi:MAG: adenylosuccinate lyase, partial [Spirochaetaceae bacterium]|nr:adenylosuccinate lyase [Spirochaetaceae bacterium]
AGDLRGKMSGAMGAYNSTSMITADPTAFEREILSDLGLEPADHATQMVQPEHLLRLLLEMNTAFGILANLADDLRNLQRTEIDEVREGFASGQVGSSTMPQKRNPWNSEHVKSLWKAFAPRVVTFFSDQISEHQRDLTNSASSRFVADYLAGFAAAAARMLEIVSDLHVNTDTMRLNAALTGDLALSEAAYTLLAAQGISDAHERVRKATLAAEAHGEPLLTILQADSEIREAIERGLAAVSDQLPGVFFSDSAHYTGRAKAVAVRVADDYERRMKRLGEESTR